MSTSEPVISGVDGRLDVYQLEQHALRRNADGVALLAFASEITQTGQHAHLANETFRNADNMCAGARFANQPVALGGYCTTFLVAPRLVATAAHCTGYAPVDTDLTEFRVVFGFEMKNAKTANLTFPMHDVYTAVRVSATCGVADCTLIELDRPVTGHKVLKIRRSGTLSPTASVYVMGYPFALPLKYDAPTPISFIREGVIFAPLDIAGGNSGSPVFNATTNEVEGTLGGYSSSGISNLDATPAGCNVEHHAVPDDNYYAYANDIALLADNIP